MMVMLKCVLLWDKSFVGFVPLLLLSLMFVEKKSELKFGGVEEKISEVELKLET